jgi:hypothetical protein
MRRVVAGYVAEVRFSPDSRRLAYVGGTPQALKVYVKDLRPGSRRRRIADGRYPVWVGDSLVFITRRTVGARVLPLPPRLRGLLHLSPPSRQEVECVIAVDPATCRTTMVERLEMERLPYSHWIEAPASGGKVFLLGTVSWPSQRVTLDICTLTAGGLRRVPLRGQPDYVAWSPDGRHLACLEKGAIRIIDVTVKRVKLR